MASPSESSRRTFLKSAAACAPAAMLPVTKASAATSALTTLAPGTTIPPEQWPSLFDVAPGIINLENAYWGLMPRSTAAVYAEKTAYVNRYNSIWGRGVLPGDSSFADLHAARAALAGMMHCDTDELAITRSGSEGLQSLIVNYRGLKAGDSMICCDLDYDSTLDAVEFLREHRGVETAKFNMPEPATEANILQSYADALKSAPKAKLMLVTQVSHRTGLVLPVKQIVAMARARGVDCICDLAHGVACLDFTLPDLDCDFAAWSVHKWTMAPMGLGAMYIRKSRLADIDTSYSSGFDAYPKAAATSSHDMSHEAVLAPGPANRHEAMSATGRNVSQSTSATNRPPNPDITARVPYGVPNYPAILTIPAAVEFYRATGGKVREDHLRALRDRWVHAVADLPNVEICVPADPARYCAITSFRLKGMHTAADAQKVQHRLFDKYRIHTVSRTGVAKGPVVRVAPGLYNTVADSDALAAALHAEHSMLL